MRQNEPQERPRTPQERVMKSTMRDIPPAPLSFSSPWPPKTLKRFPEPVAPRRDRKALGIRSWNNNYPILSYAILLYIMYLMLSYAMYDILRHIVFGPNPVATRTRNQKTRSEKFNFWPSKLPLNSLKTLPKSFPDPSQTLQNEAQMEPRSLQEPFWRAFWIQASKNDAKKWPKRRQEPPNPSQNPPKILPKPSQNP